MWPITVYIHSWLWTPSGGQWSVFVPRLYHLQPQILSSLPPVKYPIYTPCYLACTISSRYPPSTQATVSHGSWIVCSNCLLEEWQRIWVVCMAGACLVCYWDGEQGDYQTFQMTSWSSDEGCFKQHQQLVTGVPPGVEKRRDGWMVLTVGHQHH